jgi:hypothetical protein
MTEKEAILVRHSVRNYKNQKIDADTGQHHRAGIDASIKKPLFKGFFDGFRFS